MSLRRVGILLGKEFRHGSKSFIFIIAIIMPLVLSLVLSLVFGNLFSEKPRLGVSDEGNSQVTSLITESDSIVGREYDTPEKLRKAVEDGALDMGIVLPPNFDSLAEQGQMTEITAYVWGESLAKDRLVLGTTIANMIRDVAGQEVPVEIVTTSLGDDESIPWDDRILPIIVLLAIVFGGIMVPATSLVDEKQKRTLSALAITPASLMEIFVSKGLVGVVISIFMGVLVLVLNQAFGSQPLLLVGMLALGAVMASTFGIMLGAFIKDITSLFAINKAIGILYYAPAFVYLFPGIPQWVGRIFPTYYIVQPVVEISQQGGTWSDVAPEAFILIGLILVMIGIVGILAKRTAQREALA
ncbi:MAG: ABC transporter permease [Dehalococcoidales bacterium]|nr:MAG: ABC transporter permease [Dehalococcoidales bacterium]